MATVEISPAGTTPRKRPNRILELARARGLNYAAVADRAGVHELTITRLSTGKIKLTQDWMERLAQIFDVTPAELISTPIAAGMQAVKVKTALAANSWREFPWDESDGFEIMIPIELAANYPSLYAGRMLGESMNKRYPSGSIVIASQLRQLPGEIKENSRYHVRVHRADGLVEDTVRMLVKDARGETWLQYESSEPEFGAIPFSGAESEFVRLVGLVRFALIRE